MWISNDYYNKLLETLEAFSKGCFDFDENIFYGYNAPKYKRITDTLVDIKETSKQNVENCLIMVDSIIEGTTYQHKLKINTPGDYKIVYDRYLLLMKYLKKMNNDIKTFKSIIIESGKLNSTIDVDCLSGMWKENVNNLNEIIGYFVQNIDEITMILTKVAEGDLTQKFTTHSKGKILEVKNTINRMVDQLSLFASEVTRVAKEVGIEGKLGGEAEVNEVSGTWLDLTNNVNNMATSITSQVRNIAEVTTAVAEGDLTQKITVDAKGEILELKNTMNTMVDQLSQFASEVTRVAKEVGTEGKLGGQAKVSGVSGTWLDLTNNVNDMATSITYQVRNIAEVTTAVAEGDLTQKITVDAKGEILELKNTINTMVDQLSQFASEVTRVAKEVGTDGKLGGQATVDDVSGIWLDLTNNVNNMANSLTYQVRNIAEVTTAVAEGDLTQKITTEAKGEILELKNTINTMVDQLSQFASEVTRVAKEVGTEGKLGGQAKVANVSGTWLDLTNNVNDMANSITYQVRNIAEVTTAVADGDLTQKITVDAKGEIMELKNTINTMVDQLSQFASEVTRVAKEVGTEGKLGGQAKVDDVSGTWLDLTNNVNNMANSITYQVRNIAEVTTAVADGDLTQKITVDAKGEIMELKNTINTMVDQLSQFASEVTRVAKEVGTDGKLGGQAKVDGVSGTWLDLTNNVNNMANSLTYQVRNIAEVTTAVADGDLTQKITTRAKGEILELKNTINTMVDQLSQFASEVTRVTKEVGTDVNFGAQAKVDNASGIWLDLTNNVNIMSTSLAEFDSKNKNQSWIKDGISILSKEILYKELVTEQFQIAINQVCNYINAGMGVIYIYDSMTETLKLEASYSYISPSDELNTFALGEGIIGQVAYDKKPILIESENSNQFIRTGTTEYKIGSTYTSPLIFKEDLVGVIEVATYNKFDKLQIEYIENALSVLAGSFYAALIQARDHKKLEAISNTDSLTGLYNRGYFDKIGPNYFNNEKRADGLVAFAILDIDFFKNFNDLYGHKIGDMVLKSVSDVLTSSFCRDRDYCFRIGGEEFAVIFSAGSRGKAYQQMVNVKNKVEALEIVDDNGKIINNITISAGLTFDRAANIESFENLFEETDKLLYKAKESGRNIIVLNE